MPNMQKAGEAAVQMGSSFSASDTEIAPDSTSLCNTDAPTGKPQIRPSSTGAISDCRIPKYRKIRTNVRGNDAITPDLQKRSDSTKKGNSAGISAWAQKERAENDTSLTVCPKTNKRTEIQSKNTKKICDFR